MLAGVSHDLRTDPHPLPPAARADRGLARRRGAEEGRRRHEPHARRLPRLRPRRQRRGHRGDRHRRACSREIGRQARITGHATEVHLRRRPDGAACGRRPSSAASTTSSATPRATAGRIAVTGSHAEGRLTITVDDDGPGIPPRSARRCSSRSTGSTTPAIIDESGTGLGLPIARDIARNHGGDIALRESPLGGLRVTVTIPA